MINYCSKCGCKIRNYIPEKTNYCSHCGAKLLHPMDSIPSIFKTCSICHKRVNVNSSRIVECSYCNAIFHVSCITPWLVQHNTCPLCQNVYLLPKFHESIIIRE